MENGAIQSSTDPYEDRAKLEIENGKDTYTYTLFSKKLANYVLKTADKDMPSTVEFSHTPDTIRPGEIITIFGDGSTENSLRSIFLMVIQQATKTTLSQKYQTLFVLENGRVQLTVEQLGP